MKAILSIPLITLCLSLAHADIRPHHSGAWYNPDQSGHGLSIQVLDDERTVAFWFTYTPDGLPMFLLIDGVNEGHTVTGPAYYLEGMTWRAFDPDTLNTEVWGEISIEFLGCNDAILTWSSGMEGYGDGQVELQRLTHVAGLGCDDVAAEMTGEWQVEFTDAAGVPFPAVVDASGAFEFHDGLACRWEGHFHVESLERGYLSARFGSPNCPFAVPMLDAGGRYHPDGVTFCSSGGSCISYDQAMIFESEWFEGRTIGLVFLR